MAQCCWCQAEVVWAPAPYRSSEFVPEGHWWCSTQACRVKQRTWAVARTIVEHGGGRPVEHQEFLFVPLPKQVEFLASPAMYKLYGGAAGPGKSFAARWGLYRLAMVIPGFRALLLRESFKELEQTHFADMEVEQDLIGGRFLRGSNKMVFDRQKSTIFGGHFEDKAAIRHYLSTNYDVIFVDEGSQSPPDELLELTTRARTSKASARPWVGDGQAWICTNPGGPASSMLRDFFITKTPDFSERPALRDKYDPSQWCYIPALLDDNPYSAESYEQKLSVLTKTRHRQLRYGDWDAVQGTFFEQLSKTTHCREVELPRPIRGAVEAMDWGYTSPGTVAWYVPVGDGHWHVLDEWKFQKLTAEQVAAGILERRALLGIAGVSYTVADPAIFAKTGHGKGESIAETLGRFGVPCRPGDNDRMSGWVRLAAAYDTAPDGVPWLTYSPACTYSLRAIPQLLADKHNPEDVDTRLDDHCVTADTQILTSTGSRPIVDVRVGDQVWTRDGWRRVVQWMDNGEKPVLRVELSDGSAVTITGNHPVWTADRGFIRADRLRYSDILSVCQNPHNVLMPWSFAASSSAAILTRAAQKIATTTSRMATGFSEAWRRSTEKCGRRLMGQFPMGTTFTISTATLSTTPSITWPLWSAAFTSAITPERDLRTATFWTAFGRSRQRGTDRQRAAHARASSPETCGPVAPLMSVGPVTCAENPSTDTPSSDGSARTTARRRFVGGWAWIRKIAPARSVARSIAAIGIRVLNRARNAAPRVVGIFPAGTARVYNLSVEGTPEYFANGILVHNCADRDRYFVMSRPLFTTAKAVVEDYPVNSWGWWRRFHARAEEPDGVLA